MTDWIQGEKFRQLADHIFDPDTYFNFRNMKTGEIVYTDTKHINLFFSLLIKSPVKIILISHNSDTNIDHSVKIPDNVIVWYSQNVNVRDNRIQSLPIGLENNKFQLMWNKKQLMWNKLKESKQIRNLLYINHSVKTNTKERVAPYVLFECESWVTAKYGKNGKDFDQYIDNVYNHKFVLCPEGNGIDTVRLWETLYMGSIPVVKRCINTNYYMDLPICFVNDWREITEDFLNDEYDRIISKNWNMQKLTFSYWRNLICS